MLRIQRQGRRRDRRAGEPEQRSRADQHLGAGGEGSEHGRAAERGGPDQQEPAAADPVAERAHRDQRARHHEPVDVDDPQQLRAARLEVLADLRDREVKDRQIHHVEHAGERDRAQPDPLAPAGARRCDCDLDGVLSGHRELPPPFVPNRPSAALELIDAPR
jgi:hypothetical protein